MAATLSNGTDSRRFPRRTSPVAIDLRKGKTSEHVGAGG
jgi:hypothetical protein